MSLDSLKGKKVHLLGIGGIGVSAIARFLKAQGVEVNGCDVRESTLTTALRSEGIRVDIGHRPSHVDENDVIVYSTAIPAENPEFAYAKEHARLLLHRSEVLSIIVDQFESVGVTGTNGKGTVSAMLTWILETAGRDPSFYIGGLSPNLKTNARVSSGPNLVAELDESDGSLLNIHPKFAVLNNLELDHLNYYKSLDHAVETLLAFFQNLPEGSTCFFNADDEGTLSVARQLECHSKVFFGRNLEADVRYEPLETTNTFSRFRLFARTAEGETEVGVFTLKVPGSYNMENAAAACAVALTLGVSSEAIATALESFQGLNNRYTVVEAAGRTLVKDYMSHPMGIRKVLDTARLGNPGTLYAVFKPYRYTMINYHVENYADAFSKCDEVIVTEMWEAGEDPIPGVDTQWLAGRIAKAGVRVKYIKEMPPIADYLAKSQKRGDCVVFFGGNDLFEVADGLAKRFEVEADAEG